MKLKNRIHLKKKLPSDYGIQKLWKSLRDLKTVRYFPIEGDFLQFKTAKELKHFLKSFLKKSPKNHYFFIYQGRKLIGYIVLVMGRYIALLIMRDSWGKGYGTESMRLFLDHYFNVMNKRVVELGVHAENKAAITIYKKLGFRKIGKMGKHKTLVSIKPKKVEERSGFEMVLRKGDYIRN
jgi:RimJ/RimL family protein N-acetyltransferase